MIMIKHDYAILLPRRLPNLPTGHLIPVKKLLPDDQSILPGLYRHLRIIPYAPVPMRVIVLPGDIRDVFPYRHSQDLGAPELRDGVEEGNFPLPIGLFAHG